MEANNKCPLFAFSFLLITVALTSNTASILAEARHLLDTTTLPDDVPSVIDHQPDLPITIPALPELPVTIPTLPGLPTIGSIPVVNLPLPQILPKELPIPNLAAILPALPSLPKLP